MRQAYFLFSASVSMYFRVQLALREGKNDCGRVYEAKNITRADWTIGDTLVLYSPRPRPRSSTSTSTRQLQLRQSHTHSIAVIGLTLSCNDDHYLSPAIHP